MKHAVSRPRPIPFSICLGVVAAAGSTASAQLKIVPTYTAAVQGDSNFPQIKSAFEFAAAQFESRFTDPVTVNITVDEVPGTGVLGMSSSGIIGIFSYTLVRGLLSADSTTVTDATSTASLPTTDPTASGQFWLSRAQYKALQVVPPLSPGADGTFTFGAGFIYTFDPINRVAPGAFDFIGVAMHEISEIMGRIPGLNNPSFPYYLANDLFRYTAPNVRSMVTNGTNVFFSIDSGVTNLVNFNSTTPGDLQDYAGNTPDSFNAFLNIGTLSPLTGVGLINMDVIGWDRADTQIFTRGVCDCFATPSDPASPSANLRNYIAGFQPNPGPVNFDDPQNNRWFVHSFENLPKGCITGAKLTITARPNGSSLSTNDTIAVGYVKHLMPTVLGWDNYVGYYFGTGNGGTTPTLFTNDWNETNYPPTGCGATTTIDLSTRVGSSGLQTVLQTINASGALDIYVQDDTSIDCLTLTLTVDPSCSCPAALEENADYYPLGTLCGPGGGLGGWEEWTGNTGYCAEVSNDQASSGTQSIKVVGNVGAQGDDTVHPFNLVGGRYELSAMTYVPTTATGTAYMVMLNTYPTPLNWSLILPLDANAGTISDFNIPSSSTPLLKGVWVPLVVDVDLGADKVNCFYGGVQFITNKSWINGSTGGGMARIQAVDLYGGEPSTGGTSGTYFDDLILHQICSISSGGCYANCDFSTLAPILNVNDFTCFLNKYAVGDPYANCDASTIPPVLNVNDFTCFLNQFAVGCP